MGHKRNRRQRPPTYGPQSWMGGKSWQQGTSRQRVGEEPCKVQTAVFIEVSKGNNFWKKVVKKELHDRNKVEAESWREEQER